MRNRLPATIVKEYVWCPVAAWLAANLGHTPPPTPRMVEGREEHRTRLDEVLRAHGYTDARRLPPLPSRRWPLVATPDAYSPSKKHLIEVKKVAKTDKRLYRIQAMLYAVIAAENRIPVEKVILIGIEDNRRIEIPVDTATHQTIEKIVESTLNIINQPLPPPTPQPPQKCKACRWRRFCPEAQT